MEKNPYKLERKYWTPQLERIKGWKSNKCLAGNTKRGPNAALSEFGAGEMESLTYWTIDDVLLRILWAPSTVKPTVYTTFSLIVFK